MLTTSALLMMLQLVLLVARQETINIFFFFYIFLVKHTHTLNTHEEKLLIGITGWRLNWLPASGYFIDCYPSNNEMHQESSELWIPVFHTKRREEEEELDVKLCTDTNSSSPRTVWGWEKGECISEIPSLVVICSSSRGFTFSWHPLLSRDRIIISLFIYLILTKVLAPPYALNFPLWLVNNS